MRQALVAVGLLTLVGFAIWFATRSDGVALAPTEREAPNSSGTTQPRPDAPIQRAAVEPPVEQTPIPGAGGNEAPETPEPGTNVGSVDETPNVTITAIDAATRNPVPAFRVTFSNPGTRVRAAGETGRASLLLPTRSTGELLLEATDYVPFRVNVTAPERGEPARHVEAFLDRAAIAAGITITANSPTGQPVPHVRVDAWRLSDDANNPQNLSSTNPDWRRGRLLWSRRTGVPTGRYQLPELEPGNYGIRLLATDEHGELLPLLPFARTFELTGTNGFDEHTTLETGCVLGLEIVDARGNHLDPKQRAIELDLRLAGGPEVSRRWVQVSKRGRLAADDAPPGAGACWLDEPIAGALYRVRVTVDGRQAVDQQLVVRAGQRQSERIVIH